MTLCARLVTVIMLARLETPSRTFNVKKKKHIYSFIIL